MAKDINIKIKSDSKEAESGIKKVTSQLNSLSKDIKKSDVTKFAKSFTAVTAATAGAVAGIKKVNATIKETTELYRKQATAEKQLEVAAKNNPYLNSQSVQSLKDYAGYLQSISTHGDEELLPFMAQLASAGRTQAEIQQIMSAALDVSASGMMSLDSAVSSLNKTYSGSVGLLGNQISELKTLTAEQLKNGDAVKLVADKFKGMSEEVAKATGSSEQLKNAIGDMKEEIGAGFEKGLAPMRRFFTELISGWTNAKKARREYEESKTKVAEGTGDSNDIEKVLKEEKAQMDFYQKQVKDTMALLQDQDALQKKIQDSRGYLSASTFKTNLANQQAQYELHAAQVKQLEEELRVQKELEEAKAKADADAQKQAELEAERLDRDKRALKLQEENQKALDKQIEQIRLKAQLNGEEVDEQEILNAMIQSYISLVTTDTSLVSQNNSYAQKRLELVQAYAEGLRDVSDILSEVNELEDENGNKTKTLKEIYAEIQEELTEFTDTLSDIEKVLDGVEKITSQATDLALQSVEAQTSNEIAELEKQYDDGLLSYEEYQEQKKNINKKAAQEEYKLKMWEWHASLLTATANVAQGISKAIADNGYPLGLVMGSLAAISGGLAISNIAANKPQAPSFATGGIVPGNSYTGDNVRANVNSGEMILNASQQAQLWNLANGHNAATSINMPVTIQNNNGSAVRSNFDKNGLVVIIDDIVNASMQAGKYTESMNVAQSKAMGSNYF